MVRNATKKKKTNGKQIKKPPALPDSIFFIKDQIKLGTLLTYFGRLSPMSQWRVERIVSHKLSPTHKWQPEQVRVVRYLSDIVYMRRVDTKFIRQGKFSHLSYSAIWRIL